MTLRIGAVASWPPNSAMCRSRPFSASGARRKHGVRPHRLDTHMVSNDPDFETKAADVIGLYLDPVLRKNLVC